MVQAADLLSAIHNSLHHGIQAQNDTTKGGNCLFCSCSFCCCSFPSMVYSAWFVLRYYLSVCPKHSNFGLFCSIGFYIECLWSLLHGHPFSLITSPLYCFERSSPRFQSSPDSTRQAWVFSVASLYSFMPLLHFFSISYYSLPCNSMRFLILLCQSLFLVFSCSAWHIVDTQ